MKPIIKWAGGKRALLPQLKPLLPHDVTTLDYVEPFAGGAAMFFELEPGSGTLVDNNEHLMNMYRVVRDDVEELITALGKIKEHTADTYYARRDLFNKKNAPHITRVHKAALFLYLNQTCFNGLYRVNRSGKFNVPVGKPDGEIEWDIEKLRVASVALAGKNLLVYDFVREHFPYLAKFISSGSFIYLDPPYVPTSATSNFTSYSASGFGPDEHRQLREIFAELTRAGTKVMLSNSNTPFVRKLYAGFDITEVFGGRSVGASGATRGKVRELVIRNYT